ncbi:MAG: hypothetical protein AAFP17_16640 [Pseudomonadota bacterium]
MGQALTDLVGFAAGALVLLSFSMTSMLPLRLLGIGSNLAFIAYALMAGLLPVFLLHALLLPINLRRLLGMSRSARRAGEARNAPRP